MTGISKLTPRRMGGSLAMALLMLATVGCDVHVGWSGEYSGPLHGRTAPRFADACNDIDGTLAEVQGGAGNEADSSCTMPNGDAITCNWEGERCTTVCQSTEQECAKVRDLAYVPPVLKQTRALDSGTPVATRGVPANEASAGL